MTDDVAWGPWIEHDGKACPPHLIGRHVQVEIESAATTSEGQKKGEKHCEEGIVTPEIAASLAWTFAYFGALTRNRHGFLVCVGRILRYRIRKDRSVELMKAKAAALDCVSPKVLADV